MYGRQAQLKLVSQFSSTPIIWVYGQGLWYIINISRMPVYCIQSRCTGIANAQVEMISELEERHARLLALLPEPLRRHYWDRHHAASSEPGSGRWCFPSPIMDERAWRRALADR